MKSIREKTKARGHGSHCTEYDNSPDGLQEPRGFLSTDQQERIRSKTHELYVIAGRANTIPEVQFNLKGKAAGQWRIIHGREQIRFNPLAFVLDWDAHFPATVAHEVAHSIVYRIHGPRGARPHGPEWQACMQAFGCKPRVTHNTPLPGRKMKTHEYICDCQRHSLSARRHYLIQRKHYRYQCRYCGTTLRPEASPG